MRSNNELIRFSIIGLAALILAFLFPLFMPAPVVHLLDDLPVWYTYSLFREYARPLKIVGVVVDQHSLSRMPHRWPWKRSVYADMVRVLDREGVNTVGIDFVFAGASEDPQDDLVFSETLRNSTARVVLSYFFDPRRKEPVFPLSSLKESAYALGLLNTPSDPDGKIRRLRSYISAGGETYYSFPVAVAASFLNVNPENIVASFPLTPDRTFPVNYMLNEHDLVRVSFYDVLENLDGLKEIHGKNFLEGSLVMVFSDAELLPDSYRTPLGSMPGGMLHVNGVANILTGRLVYKSDAVLFLFALISFVAILYILRYAGFIVGSVMVVGLIFFNFWSLVILSGRGLAFDFPFITIFIGFFFLFGSLYRYLSFLAQVLKIKEKATLDPLRNIFTPRYFYYRLALETRKFYVRKEIFLVFISFSGFRDAADIIPIEELKKTWNGISLALRQRGRLWAVYSADEVMGCCVMSSLIMEKTLSVLKASLEAFLARKGIVVRVKIAYAKYRRSYPVREFLFALSGEARKSADDIVLLSEEKLAGLLEYSGTPEVQQEQFLETFGEDIEDKNKELLSLIENLKKEHNKTRESFFQIITSLVKALEARDPYTEGHSERVSMYALMLAEKLKWTEEPKEKLKMAALLHDLGKIGIPDKILHKKGHLNDSEYDYIKKHEIIAVRILEPLKEVREILPWILYHHERWDGKGYPHGLGGDSIPEASQIIAIADVFDTLTTGRDYKIAFPTEHALQEITKNKGSQFNPRLVDLFTEIISASIHNPNTPQ